MITDKMLAYVLDGSVDEMVGAVREIETSLLQEGEVTLKVEYSSINFKDAMINAGLGRMIRKFPHVPGIDFSGLVLEDTSGRFREGEQVSLTGYEVGMGYFGGYAQIARVPADWVVKLPPGMNTLQASALGTAGLTAMLAVMELEKNGLKTGQGPVLVNGASGGVGSIAVAILARTGYSVTAGTGKAHMRDLLGQLGAESFLTREEMVEESPKFLLKEEWAGAMDQVGGAVLEYILRTTKIGGSVAVTGNVMNNAFSTTVLPFILRGVKLLGVNSQHCSMETRLEAWQRLAEAIKPDFLPGITNLIGLEDLPEKLQEILAGGARGRYVVKLPN